MTGSKPPTALKSRGMSRGMTGMTGSRRGTGTAASSASQMKDALTDTLVKKMREKFADVAMDVRAQDIIGSEVVGFMQAGGSVKDEDISALEDRIRSKLAGGTAKPLKAMARKKESDEWAMLAKFESDQNVLEEIRRREMVAKQKLRMRDELDAQMSELERKKMDEKEREAMYAAEEARALEEWKEEEKMKLNKRQAQMTRLKLERDAQLEDQAMRKEQAIGRRKAEEDDAREMLRLEHKRKMEADEMARNQSKLEMDQLKLENQKNLEILEERRQQEMKEDLLYQKKMAQMLDKQEMERREKMDAIKAKQDKLTAGGAPRPLKQWMDEGIIERNAAEREALLDKMEEEKMEKQLNNNLEMRKVLAAQLKEKEARKHHASALEAERVNKFNSALKESEHREQKYKAGLHEKRLLNKADLETQMRENALRRTTEPAMNQVEKTLNSKLLDKVSVAR